MNDKAQPAARRFESANAARAAAKANRLTYGWSISQSEWYVGTPEQLTAVGVRMHIDPTRES